MTNQSENAAADLTITTDCLGATRSWKTLKTLIENKVFNCKSCGSFFKAAVFFVDGEGTVCQDCLNKNKWQGGRLRFFDAALQDLPVVPCTNADDGCKLQVLDEDLEAHLMEDCKYRLVNCISPGCSWQNKQDGLAKHFEETHQADVIREDTAFNLDISRETFVVTKLFIKKNAKYFLVIRREFNSNHLWYDAFQVETGNTHDIVILEHFCASSEDYKLTIQIDTKELNMFDKACASKRISLLILNEISEDRSDLLLTVKVKTSKSKQQLGFSECGDTVRRPVCQNEIDVETRNGSLEALTSDVKYSCANQPFGCKVNILRDEIEQHELKCAYALNICPVPNCSYRNSNDELFKQHVSIEHEKYVLQGNEHGFSMGPNVTEDISFMLFDNCLFEVRYSCKLVTVRVYNKFLDLRTSPSHNDIKFSVRLLSNNPTVSNYLCNIECTCNQSLSVSLPLSVKNVLITKDNKIACWSLSKVGFPPKYWFLYVVSLKLNK